VRPPHIWILQTGEQVPLPGTHARLLRSGLLADALAARGATVTWWASTFDHKTKSLIGQPGHVDRSRPGIDIRLLHGRTYAGNVSLKRILHQRDEARDFRARASEAPRPDLIFASLPTIDLADAAMTMARDRNVPGFIDYRDLWPEAFLDVSPLPKLMTRPLIEPMFRAARRALSKATGVTSITSAFLDKSLELAGRAAEDTDKVFVHAYQRPRYDTAALEDAAAFWRAKGVRLDGSQQVMCYFGMLTEQFPFNVLLDGIASLPADLRHNLRAVICGPGSQFAALSSRAAHELPEVVVAGFVDGPKIAALMQGSAAGLLPYPDRKDLMMSYPNKVGEYLSAGLPILSSLGGFSARLIANENVGIKVTPSGASWGQALTTLLTETETRETMRANARRLYASMFDADHVYDAFARHLMVWAQAPARIARAG
jgi:glycosyltransferase involved in cell wall biosynthesis